MLTWGATSCGRALWALWALCTGRSGRTGSSLHPVGSRDSYRPLCACRALCADGACAGGGLPVVSAGEDVRSAGMTGKVATTRSQDGGYPSDEEESFHTDMVQPRRPCLGDGAVTSELQVAEGLLQPPHAVRPGGRLNRGCS
jgi:hypothetical protein